jgi:gliding motility-associated-like protein
MNSRRTFYLLIPLLFAVTVAHAHRPHFLFSPNKGQWHPNVLYRTNIPGGEMYMERDGITFHYYDQQKLKYIHDNKGKELTDATENIIDGVTVRTKLLGASTSPNVSEKLFTEFYENWFIGKDESKHTSKVFPAEELHYKDIYPGIDWVWYEKEGFLKYDYRIKAGSDPGLIKTKYTGQHTMEIDFLGNLISTTSLSLLKEEKPFAYQINKNGDTSVVACKYVLDGDVVSYGFPTGYDASLDLIIDPSLIFSTYSGSFANNFGYTATYDSKGFLYSGGNVFNIGYHTTPGAFQVSYGGGNIDCAISKYDTTGTFMIWSTYLGGNGSEMPHSMVVNKLDQLFVFGTTGSSNFPVTSNAYDQTYNGGTSLNQVGVGYIEPNGSDIFVAKFSVDGSELLAATYLGGSQNDGLNLGPVLNHNYADLSRGEIDIDNGNNIYIATSTASGNFPTTANAVQSTFGGGGFDGVVLKMDNSLTTLIWSTYLGGSNNDAVYSLAVDKKNNIVVTGGTMSSNFPVKGSAFQTHNGGVDAFITIINTSGTVMEKSILYGTAAYDQAYFVELDNQQNIYLLGQTNAANGYFYTGTGFGVTNGNQFISKFLPDLSARDWSTAFGNQSGHPDISPTAFLVDVCRKIYLSGWGGSVNGTVPGSTVSGLPITSDAYQATPHNNDFYIMVLDDDASQLTYGTYYGGANSPEHVDGGTSRFNRKGEIYQSVCAGCGGFHDFPTTPGAWSATNNGLTNQGQPGCNNGVFKFLLDFPSMVADFDVPPSLCAPATVNLQNFSSGATEYFWDLGNGQTSTDENPTASYTTSGVYNIMLVTNNTSGTTCNLTDTVIKQMVVLGLDAQDLPDASICDGLTTEIGMQPVADPSITYQWIPSVGLSDPTAPNPLFSSSAGSRLYQIIISNGLCSDTLLQQVNVSPLPTLSLNDTLVCAGIPFGLGFPNPPAGMSFNWTPASGLSSSTAANPTLTPSTSVTYSLVYGYPGCKDSLERTVNVLSLGFFTPVDTSICPGDTIVVSEFPPLPGVTYTWTPTQWVSNPTIPNPSLFPPSAQDFNVIISNGLCSDTVVKHIGIILKAADAGNNDTICAGQSVVIGPEIPSNFLVYSWTPGSWLSSASVPNPTATPLNTTSYILNVHAAGNINSCASSDTVTIVVSSPGAAGAGFKEFAGCYGMSVSVKPNGNPNYQYQWYTNTGQTGTGTSPSFEVPYDTTVIFYMVVTGEGCTDTIAIPHTFGTFESQWGQLIVPNIFTPNNDNINECFGPSGAPDGCYWLYVYNRWGVLMFDSEKVGQSCWNGNYMKTNTKVVDGVYFWVLELGGVEHNGTVTVAGSKGGH